MRLTLIATKVNHSKPQSPASTYWREFTNTQLESMGFWLGWGGRLGFIRGTTQLQSGPYHPQTRQNLHQSSHGCTIIAICHQGEEIFNTHSLTHPLTSLNFFHAAEHPHHPCAVNMLSCFTRKRNERERQRESHMLIFANLFGLKLQF